MPKPKKIDLNQYELVDSEEELDGYTGIIVIPKKLHDGTQPPVLHFRKESNIIHIVDTDNATWFKDCRISQAGSQMDYIKRIDWWFDNALADEEYRQILINMYKTAADKYGFDLKKRIDQSKGWLKSLNGTARKTYIHKSFIDSMNRGVNFCMKKVSPHG
jgi:hypothetical protein